MLSTGCFKHMTSYQNQIPRFLNIFTFFHFLSKFAPFKAPNPSSYYFDFTNCSLQSPQNGALIRNQIRVPEQMYTTHPDTAVLGLEWWAGVTDQAELQLLPLLALLRYQNFRPPSNSQADKNPAVVSQNILSHFSNFRGIGRSVFSKEEMSGLGAEKESEIREK